MISTYLGLGTLDGPSAFLAAGLIGLLFGFGLERAGLGSSRKLTGVFYFRDMTVIKVMVTAFVSAMLGLHVLLAFGIVAADQIHWLPTGYGAQVVGGLLFGAGFALSGWCPGTGAVGLASGRVDALVFLVGVILGSVVFNELFPLLTRLLAAGDRGVVFAWETLRLPKGNFILGLAVLGSALLIGAEFVERSVRAPVRRTSWPLLAVLCVALLGVASGFLILPQAQSTPVTTAPAVVPTAQAPAADAGRMAQVERGAEHIDPEDLADRIMRNEPGLLVVDVRSPGEYATFHLKGAVNIALSQLEQELGPRKNQGTVVLYSNGMIHPAQAADFLARRGFANVFILTDGLEGFMKRVLKPVSLREPPLSGLEAARVNVWRDAFLGERPGQTVAPSTGAGSDQADQASPATAELPAMPGLASVDWLAANLGRPWLRIIDLRSQPDYNGGHIPGSVCLNVESLRGVVGGVSSMLLPADMLARHFSLMGVAPLDVIAIVPGERPMDATLVSMACERIGHSRYLILDGGFPAWKAAAKPLDALLPDIVETRYYPVPASNDGFTVGYRDVLAAIRATPPSAVILDVRPVDFFQGTKSDEARGGHIPGAINRPFSDDLAKDEGGIARFKPTAELEEAYAAILPAKDAPVIVHCRTGHQASQTVFVLKRLLGYANVRYYDAGWSEWASRPELPVETGPAASR